MASNVWRSLEACLTRSGILWLAPVLPGGREEANDGSGKLLQVLGGRLASARVSHDVVLDLLALGQTIEAGALNGADMNKGVLSTVIWRNETEALTGVEPLHSSLHRRLFQSGSCWPARHSLVRDAVEFA